MNKLIRVEKGRYAVIDASGNTIAFIYKHSSGKGYTRNIRNTSGAWFRPDYFNYFHTLADVKRRYDIK